MKCWEQGDIDEKVRFSIRGHEDVSKSNGHLYSHGSSMGLQVVATAKLDYSVNREYFRYSVGIGAFSLPWLRPLVVCWCRGEALC